ncbi:MAG: alpha/beta hydrolase [Bacteroidota bacterium]
MKVKLKITLVSYVLFSQSFFFAQTELPKTVFGRIERIENFKSAFVTSRNVDVLLPEGYSTNEKYAVLYIHDGQMLFDKDITWNKQSWEMDEASAFSYKDADARKFIIVGIWNGGVTRHADYFPQRPYEMLSDSEKDTIEKQLIREGRTNDVFIPNSDNYLKFLVKELKPLIDKKYSVHSDKNNTFIAGSSMGGLISIYAICEYPEIFGAAVCISTHWPGIFTLVNNPFPEVMFEYLEKKLPDANEHRIYFDCGNQTLDSLYPNFQKKVDAVIKKHGYKRKNWITKYFPGDDHSEESWAKRVHIPIKFIMKK